ncbi:MAG: pyruvate carboxylase subunit B [Spirochaetales bacterium]|nr:pyruvate carboxylase subunit B [Spirochaetales bacterium]
MKPDNHGKVELTGMQYGKKRPKAANPVKIQDLTFRDGHQSIFATRGRTEDMIHIAESMDNVGFYSMEVWGGATFDAAHRYLGEDPWERIRVLKRYLVNTPLSMLLRGQNLVGYRNYADDVVEAFVGRACDNGIDIFRVFDALNDFRNFSTAVKVIQKNKKHFQGSICYSLTEQRMGGDVYNLDYYVKKAKQLQDMGADSICIKDMAGLIAPYDAYNLIRTLKEEVKIPIQLHTHFTSGMGDLALQKAIEAGVDIVDTCMAPYAYRTSHPAIEPIVVSLLGTNRDTGFDIEQLAEIDKEIEGLVPKYRHFLDSTRLSVIDINVLLHQTPGGMLSNLVNQLKQMGELDRLHDVFEELPRVRKDLGQVPLVTPTSQIVGIQTVNNVLFDKDGDRYSKITEQVKDLCFGLYGKTPVPINPEVMEKALKDYPRGNKPITCRPGEILEPELGKVKEDVKDLAKDMDDVLVCALFPVTGKRFLKWKYGLEEIPPEVKPKTLEDVKKENELIEKALAGELAEKPKKEVPQKPEHIRAFDVFVDGEYFKVEVNEQGDVQASVTPPIKATYQKPAEKSAGAVKQASKPVETPVAIAVAEGGAVVTAPMPGMIVDYQKGVGDKVKAGETILVIEAMKMNNNIDAPCNGVVKEISHSAGDSVAKGAVLAVIEKE